MAQHTRRTPRTRTRFIDGERTDTRDRGPFTPAPWGQGVRSQPDSPEATRTATLRRQYAANAAVLERMRDTVIRNGRPLRGYDLPTLDAAITDYRRMAHSPNSPNEKE